MFRFLTAGESHGPALSAIIEGLPANLTLDFDAINRQLKRRQGGYGRGARQQIETDTVEITSGVRFGRTMGGPITLLVRNRDTGELAGAHVGHAGRKSHAAHHAAAPRPRRFRRNAEIPLRRPAPHPGTVQRAQHRRARCCGRDLSLAARRRSASKSSVTSLPSAAYKRRFAGPISYRDIAARAEESPVRCADPDAEARMIAAIDVCMQEGTRDTLGGVV